MKIRTFTLALLFFSLSAYAQEENSEALLMFEGLSAYVAITTGPYILELTDDVSDGCMPSPDAVEQSWEVELRRLGYTIIPEADEKESVFSPKILIEAFGFGNNEYNCAVMVQTSLELYFGGNLPYTDKMTLSRSRIPVTRHLLTGGKNDMGERISNLSRDHVNELYLMMERTKERFQKEYPQFLSQHMAGKMAASQEK